MKGNDSTRAPRSPAAADAALSGFAPPTQAWFRAAFAAPTEAQGLAWPLIRSGQSALILAPTGSGKTLAAFLATIDRLMFSPAPPREARCRVLYISPLKALAVDVERNLRAPLTGVTRSAERLGYPFHLPQLSLRTGDTPARERVQFQKQPSDILITTPESLYLMLLGSARSALRSVECVIIDEVHAMLPTKRGAHLALSLERLEALTGKPLQRIGLTATVRPLDEAARFLGGMHNGAPRPVALADARARKVLDLRVEVPVEDLTRPGAVQQAELESPEILSGPASLGLASERRASVWPAMHPLILDLIRAHQSTLIFVNSRRLAERLAAALNELAGKELVRAHHGSLARAQRQQIEDELKAGLLPALCATSSLELGIDMGAIDLVIQVEAPPSIASAIQRIGRAGHVVGAPSKGVILPKFRGDLLACAALSERAQAGAVEALRYPRNPLDVLAQHLVAAVVADESEAGLSVEALFTLVRGAAPFAELPRGSFDGVLELLSGRYPSDDFAELRPRLTWDRLAGTLKPREGARRVAVVNAGTIPDRGLYGVFLAGTEAGKPVRVGELDEEMVFETRVGETFLLGASSWRVEEITHDRVLVSPAPGQPGKMPFWHGDRAGRPLEFGRAIGALSRELLVAPPAEALARLDERHHLSPRAAENLLSYLRDQVAATGVAPDDRTIVVERFVDEMGDHRVCVLSPFGSQVHGPWAMAIQALARERGDLELDVLWTDDGIVARFPEADRPPELAALIPDPDEVEDLVARQLGQSALFAGRFREAAARALLLPRRFPGQRTALWQQRRRSADLLKAAAKHGSFPILLEAYRETLRDDFDLPALTELLRDLGRRRLRAVVVDTGRPSPFASSLLFNYVANFIYEGDTPLAERRAQALMVDPAQLRELLGAVELREMLDPEALDTLEQQLQHLAPERRARHADGLHDLLLRLGDLSLDEILLRCAAPAVEAQGWLEALVGARRVIPLQVHFAEGGAGRYAAVEDAARYRDALGTPLPLGLPLSLLAPVRDPLGDLVARYARTHGPFTASACAARFGLGVASVQPALQALQAAGRLIEGAFRPGGAGSELCDTEVLRQLRQRSLAKLRQEVEPVPEVVLGRLCCEWHGVYGDGRGASVYGRRQPRGPEAVLSAIELLQGAPLPASDLERRVLGARVAGYLPHDLDGLMASGQVVWVGDQALGDKDGRVRLYLLEHLALLLPERAAPAEAAQTPLHQRLRAHLQARGASFFAQLLLACTAAPTPPAPGLTRTSLSGAPSADEVLEALWDLVWTGEVTNDTLQPLRAYLLERGGKRAGGRSAARGFGPRRGARTPHAPKAGGRWTLVRSLVEGAGQPSATERLAALARQLLQRHGVLTREAVQAEGIEGGFSAVYPVLKGLEEAGQIRRGYFVAGRGATQFALPAAVDRLRSLRDPEGDRPEDSAEDVDGADSREALPRAVVLAATDPANPYGAALPWPRQRRAARAGAAGAERSKEGERRLQRAAGALVVLVDGALFAWLPRAGKSLVLFRPPEGVGEPQGEDGAEWPRAAQQAAARALADLVRGGRKRALLIADVDGQPARGTPLGEALQATGFHLGSEGYLLRQSLGP